MEKESPIAIRAQNLKFGYSKGNTIVDIESLTISRSERVFIHGPSGTGKTTLLSLMAGILSPSEGELEILGKTLTQLSLGQRDRMRGRDLGYIFQMFNLIPYLNAYENIALVCKMNKPRL